MTTDSTSRESLINTFVSLTGAPAEEAEAILNSSDFNIERAIELFFSMNESSKGTKRLNPYIDEMESDPEIRAPDKVKYQKLLESSNLSEAVPRHYYSTRSSNTNSYGFSLPSTDSAPLAFATGSSDFRGLSAELSERSKKEQSLAQLFRPPFDLIFPGSFLEARTAARERDRWLLVNIQAEDEFNCHTLNRDVWADDTVREIVGTGFVFWQTQSASPEGRLYLQRYPLGRGEFPHIAILDPRTGGLTWRHDGPHKGVLIDKLLDFLGDNPTPSQSTSHKTHSNSSSNSNNNNNNHEIIADVTDLTEISTVEWKPVTDLTDDDGMTERSDTLTPDTLTPAEVEAKGEEQKQKEEWVRGFRAIDIQDCKDSLDQKDVTAPATVSVSGSIQFRLPVHSHTNKGQQSVKRVQTFRSDESVLATLLFISNEVSQEDINRRWDALFDFPQRSLFDCIFPSESTSSPSSIRDVDWKSSSMTIGSLNLLSGTVIVRFLD